MCFCFDILHVPEGSLSIEKRSVHRYRDNIFDVANYYTEFLTSVIFLYHCVYGNRLLCPEIFSIEVNVKVYHRAEKGWTDVVSI